MAATREDRLYFPDFEELRQHADVAERLIVYREIVDDFDTRVAAFQKLREGAWSFLLESVVGAEKWAAYSFVGVSPRAVIRAQERALSIHWQPISGERENESVESIATDRPMESLFERVLSTRTWAPEGLPRFFGGLVGFLTYDAVRTFENIATKHSQTGALPLACFVLTDTLVVFDNLRQTVKVIATVETPQHKNDDSLRLRYDAAKHRIDQIVQKLQSPAHGAIRPIEPLAPKPNGVAERTDLTRHTSPTQYAESVLRAKEFILAGDVFQVVLSERLETKRLDVEPFDLYRALRTISPSPYMYHLDFPDHIVTGASPEVLVRLEDKTITLRPIAGTRPRGKSESQDKLLAEELSADPKERAEHLMLVDLGRNDLGRVARIGSVHVEELMTIERFSHVMHMTSQITGELADSCSQYDLLASTFPAGTLSGAPKIRAMQIIDELEPISRGLYGGAVGYLSYSGNMDFAIAIRTLVTTADSITVQAGAGIVFDSVPELEFEECENKARAALRAIEIAKNAATSASGKS